LSKCCGIFWRCILTIFHSLKRWSSDVLIIVLTFINSTESSLNLLKNSELFYLHLFCWFDQLISVWRF
jgi:hypothetical protein